MESLTGTQSRQIFPPPSSTRDNLARRIKRVDERLLQTEEGEIRVGEVGLLLRELRWVVVALDGRGGFLD